MFSGWRSEYSGRFAHALVLLAVVAQAASPVRASMRRRLAPDPPSLTMRHRPAADVTGKCVPPHKLRG
jgi:hypothetical protein